MMFNEIVKKFFLEYIPITRNFSKNTAITYQNNMLIFVNFLKKQKIHIEKIKVEDLNISIIDDYIKYLKEERKNSPSTINNRISTLKSFFNYVENRNICSIDICSKVKTIKLLKIQKKIPKYFTEEEIFFIINNIPNNNIKEFKQLLIFLILYNCALRASEICFIKIEDLNIFSEKVPTIYIRKGKGGKSRYIPITIELAELIKRYIIQAKIDVEKNEFLFLNRFEKQYTRKGIYYIIEKVYEKSKEKNLDKTMLTESINPHMLRHTKAVNMVEDGININVIKSFLNHEHLSTTEIYARIGDKKLSEIIVNNAEKIKINVNYEKKEKEDLENWLKTHKF